MLTSVVRLQTKASVTSFTKPPIVTPKSTDRPGWQKLGYTFEPQESPYQLWMNEELVRRRGYVARAEPMLLSFITPVWNTPLEYLIALAESILGQDFGAGQTFDWVIADNGSTDPDVRSYLQELTRHEFIRLVQLNENTGIIGGTRVALEHSRGRYIVPVDHDDYVYPDAARILTNYIQAHNYPVLLYSDEDKLVGNRFEEAYLKPDWDPVLFTHSCYIAHLCAIDRETACSVGAYTDPEVAGCPDWDTFIRFMVAGYTPSHVPDVLYGWRKHPGSTAGNIEAKNYIHSSQRAALGRFVRSQRPNRFQLDYSPFFSGTPDWWFRRLPVPGRQICQIVIGSGTGENEALHVSPDGPISEVANLIREAADSATVVRLAGDDVVMDRADWEWEALAMLELFPDVAVVGGPLFNSSGLALSTGIYFGFGDGCGMPDRWRSRTDPGYFVQMWKPHSVSAMSSQNLIVCSGFLLDALASDVIDQSAPVWIFGQWLGLAASAWCKRVVFSPFLAGSTEHDWYRKSTPELMKPMVVRHPQAFMRNPLYSPRLALEEGMGYRPATASERQRHLEGLCGRVL
jgi:glycosyltransferase involved in cell wall biosynthesis